MLALAASTIAKNLRRPLPVLLEHDSLRSTVSGHNRSVCAQNCFRPTAITKTSVRTYVTSDSADSAATEIIQQLRKGNRRAISKAITLGTFDKLNPSMNREGGEKIFVVLTQCLFAAG